MSSVETEDWLGDVSTTVIGPGFNQALNWKFKFTIMQDGSIQGVGTEGSGATQLSVASTNLIGTTVSADVQVSGNYDSGSNEVNLVFTSVDSVTAVSGTTPLGAESAQLSDGSQGDQVLGAIKGQLGVADWNSIMNGTLGTFSSTSPAGTTSGSWTSPQPVAPSPVLKAGPIQKIEGGSVTNVSTVSGYTNTTVVTIHQYTIQLQLDQTQLDPTDSGANAMLTVTVTKVGQPAGNVAVDINVCTNVDPGSDGHLHDSRTNPCEHSRPVGRLDGSSTYPVTKSTNSSGTFTVEYTPPQSSIGNYFISGTDHITAAIHSTPNIKDEKEIMTRVSGLVPMSTDGSNCYFVPQSYHGNLFYGTAATNVSLQSIASAFTQQQLNCQSGGTYLGVQYHTPGPPRGLRITAMSLPWGGLNDIGPSASGGSAWNPPHKSHSTGMVADIGLSDFITGTDAQGNQTWDMDRVNLLLAIIAQTSGVSLPVSYEGGNLAATLANPSHHFHVQFSE